MNNGIKTRDVQLMHAIYNLGKQAIAHKDHVEAEPTEYRESGLSEAPCVRADHDQCSERSFEAEGTSVSANRDLMDTPDITIMCKS